MLTYDLEKRGKYSIYEYVYFCIREDILAGRIKAGEKLPSKREMARNHDIAVITVENAYAQLVVEGYITAKEKSGYFVNSGLQAVRKNDAAKRNLQQRPLQQTWLVDFSTSRLTGSLFPFTTWARLMRKVLSDREDIFREKPETEGVLELREAIVEYLKKTKGLDVLPHQIVVGPGTEYLHHTLLQLIGHNRLVAVEDPGYKKIGRLYESNGMKCLPIPVDGQGIVVKDLLESNASLVHISPSHHFPTGCVMPAERRQQLISWAHQQMAYIIEDDYDSELRVSGRPIPTLSELDAERVIYMNTFTKTLTPSIRIAYMVLPEGLVQKFCDRLSFTSGTVSSFEQYTLAAFMKEGYYERHISRMRNYYRQQRSRILKAVSNARLADLVELREDKAGLHFILFIPKLADDALFQQELEKKGISLASVAQFCYHNIYAYAHQFIINYTDVSEEKLEYALEQMYLAIREQL